MPLRSIPPNTVMRNIYPTSGSAPPKKQKKKVYYKPKRNTPIPMSKSTNIFTAKEIELDVFNEDGKLKLIGNFPGISIQDVVIQIDGNELCMVTKPSIDRKYEAHTVLPPGFKTIVNKEMRNGVMTLILQATATLLEDE